MGRVDQMAAEQELQKAASFREQADQLTKIASALRTEAQEREREADELRGRDGKRR